MIAKTLRNFAVAVAERPLRPEFKRTVEMSGLNLDSLVDMVKDRDSFTKIDRNYSSYKIDIVLRVIHDHFRQTRDEKKLPSQKLKEIFDGIAELMPLCRWKSS